MSSKEGESQRLKIARIAKAQQAELDAQKAKLEQLAAENAALKAQKDAEIAAVNKQLAEQTELYTTKKAESEQRQQTIRFQTKEIKGAREAIKQAKAEAAKAMQERDAYKTQEGGLPRPPQVPLPPGQPRPRDPTLSSETPIVQGLEERLERVLASFDKIEANVDNVVASFDVTRLTFHGSDYWREKNPDAKYDGQELLQTLTKESSLPAPAMELWGMLTEQARGTLRDTYGNSKYVKAIETNRGLTSLNNLTLRNLATGALDYDDGVAVEDIEYSIGPQSHYEDAEAPSEEELGPYTPPSGFGFIDDTVVPEHKRQGATLLFDPGDPGVHRAVNPPVDFDEPLEKPVSADALLDDTKKIHIEVPGKPQDLSGGVYKTQEVDMKAEVESFVDTSLPMLPPAGSYEENRVRLTAQREESSEDELNFTAASTAQKVMVRSAATEAHTRLESLEMPKGEVDFSREPGELPAGIVEADEVVSGWYNAKWIVEGGADTDVRNMVTPPDAQPESETWEIDLEQSAETAPGPSAESLNFGGYYDPDFPEQAYDDLGEPDVLDPTADPEINPLAEQEDVDPSLARESDVQTPAGRLDRQELESRLTEDLFRQQSPGDRALLKRFIKDYKKLLDNQLYFLESREEQFVLHLWHSGKGQVMDVARRDSYEGLVLLSYDLDFRVVQCGLHGVLQPVPAPSRFTTDMHAVFRKSFKSQVDYLAGLVQKERRDHRTEIYADPAFGFRTRDLVTITSYIEGMQIDATFDFDGKLAHLKATTDSGIRLADISLTRFKKEQLPKSAQNLYQNLRSMCTR